LAKFQKVRFDLILTDILMPRLDGNDMARRIRRSSFAAPPIIAMSGTPWDVQRDMFDGVLCKPFSFEDLNKLIYKIL
jgi:CheY-like chemotaxis protein